MEDSGLSQPLTPSKPIAPAAEVIIVIRDTALTFMCCGCLLAFLHNYKRVNAEKLRRTSNEDDVSNENVKKAIGLLSKM